VKLSIPLRFIVGSFAISRLIVFGVLIASAYSQAVPVDGEGLLKATFLQWDARWYERLSATGYQESHEVAFFPAFVVASRALRAVGLDFAVASIIMNNFFLLLSGVLLFLVARPLTDRTSACMAVSILFFHPLSFYFSVPYTESLLLVSVLSGFYLVSSGRYQVGGLTLAVAALTRNTGIFAAPAAALQRPLTRKWKF
jgi:Gpi18-like mannosyltransferase